MRAGTQKRPGKSDESFAGIGAHAFAATSGNRHQGRVQRMPNNVARVEFVIVALLAEDHRGIERTSEISQGAPPYVALRDAKLALLHSGTVYPRPFYWAPFQFYRGA